MNRKKGFPAAAGKMVVVAALLIAISFFAVSCVTYQMPEGAQIETVQNTVSDTGGSFYIYTPSKTNHRFVMSPMRNSVVYIYPDVPYASSDEALLGMQKNGLVDLAEENSIYLIAPNPVAGGSWSEKDFGLYQDIQEWLYGGRGEVLFFTQNEVRATSNLTYVAAEGSGATWVNDVLASGDNGKRVAAVLTFGGTVSNPSKKSLSIPAFLAGCSTDAVAFYKSLNGVDTEQETGVFINSSFPLKKVIVKNSKAAFSKKIIQQAWDDLFSTTARFNVDGAAVLTPSVFYLNERLNCEKLGITRVEHLNEKLADGTEAIWYDYIPSSVSADMSKKVPLVIAFHGKDGDPEDIADSAGWAAKAAEEGFILVAPDYPDQGITSENNSIVLQILDYALETYPVDESRIYLTGFSMGGVMSGFVGLQNPDKIAAVAIMGSTGYYDDAFVEMVESDKADNDLPFLLLIGKKDMLNISMDAAGSPVIGNIYPGSIDLLFKYNELGDAAKDYAAYPYWGFATDDWKTVEDKGLHYDISFLNKNGKTAAEFVLFEEAGHTHADYYATIGWDFLSQYHK